ncbi:AIM24 family protein, partial [Streptomyces althioticus]
MAGHGRAWLRGGLPAGAERQRRGLRPGLGGEAVSMYGTPGAGASALDPMTLPSDDNVNDYTFCVELKGT